jgi:hypothetical protein
MTLTVILGVLIGELSVGWAITQLCNLIYAELSVDPIINMLSG